MTVLQNPFADVARITYVLAGDSSDVRLALYTVGGEKFVDVTGAGLAGPNMITWDALAEGGVVNGIYVYRLSVDGQFIEEGKLVLIRD